MATIDFVVRLESGNIQNQLSESPRWRGDIVLFKAQPHNGLGRAMVPPKYGVITVTDIPADAALARCNRHYKEPDPADKTGRTALFRVRASHWINLAALPSAALEQLESTGRLTMSAAEFYIRCNNRIDALRQVYGISP